MKKLLILLTTCFFIHMAQAQRGWYIVEKNTKYIVYQRSFLDYDSTGKFYDYKDLTINVGEAVYLYEVTDKYYVVSESHGRISLIDINANTLSAIKEEGSIGYLNTTLKLENGQILKENSAIFFTKVYDIEKVATALLNDGYKPNIDLKYINFLYKRIDTEMANKPQPYKTAQ